MTKMKKLNRLFAWPTMLGLCTLMILAADAVQAQSGGSFQLTQSVIGSGGTTSVTSLFELTGTAGQHEATTALSAGGPFALAGGFWSEIVNTPPPICANNVSGQVNLLRSGFRFNYASGRFLQSVRLTNTSGNPVQGPLSLVIDNLSGGVGLFGQSGTTSCAQPSSPYITINVGSDDLFTPGEAVTVVLQFTNPSNQAISYGTRVLSGANR